MPIDQAEAIVLRTSNVGEQDKLVVLFARDKGLLKGIAKGARKFGNRFGSGLEPMSVIRVFYYEKERRDLVIVSGCDLLESFFEIQSEPATAILLSYFAELIEEFAPVRAREDVLFRLLLAVLRALRDGSDRSAVAAYFEAWFLRITGFLPDFHRCRKCRRALGAGWLAPKRDGAYCEDCAPIKKDGVAAEVHRFIDWAARNPPTSLGEPPFGPEEVARVRRTLQAMIVYHLEREPRTLALLKTA